MNEILLSSPNTKEDCCQLALPPTDLCRQPTAFGLYHCE